MKKPHKLLALLFAAVLLLAACGDSSDDDAGDTPTTEDGGQSSDAPDTDDGDGGDGVEGCDENSATDPADLSADRQVARCEPGFPAPKPLDEKTKVVITESSWGEHAAWLHVAAHMGEFEKENIEIELIKLALADAIPQTLRGDVQAFAGGPEAAFYNALGADIDIKWVLGNFTPPDAGDDSVPQTGLWTKRSVFSDPDNPDFSELEGKRFGTATGPASIIMYPIVNALEELGLDVGTMDIQQLPASDIVTALDQGAVDIAWLLDPFWAQVADDDEYMMLASQPPGETLGGLFFGEELLYDKPEVGEAIVRAIVRTVNTYLAGDYEADEELVQIIADATDSTPEAIAGGASKSLTFDWEIRAGTTDRAQQIFEDLGLLEQDIFPEDEVVDRSFYLRVVGQD